MHRIRGCGPLLLILSLLSSFQLALEHLSQDSSPISGNLILNGISLSRGAPDPFQESDESVDCFIFSRIKKRPKPKVKIVTLQLCGVKKNGYRFSYTFNDMKNSPHLPLRQITEETKVLSQNEGSRYTLYEKLPTCAA
jgi:hypothetical protein